MALSIWLNGCCLCKDLIGVSVICKEMGAVCLTACFMDRFVHWSLELTGLLYIFI